LSAVEEVSLDKSGAVSKEEQPKIGPVMIENSAEMPTQTPRAAPTSGSPQVSIRDSTEPEPSIGSPSIVPTEEIEEQLQHEDDHIEIPVPDDDDADLFCEALQVSSDQCWSMEIELDVNDVTRMYGAEHEEQVACLVSAAKKQRS